MAGTAARACSLLLLTMVTGLGDEACAASGTGAGPSDPSCPTASTSGAAFVQQRSVTARRAAQYVWEGGSDCGQRLQHWSTRPAACLVVRDGRALLVKVPYGSRPGWDFPGGYHKGREAACETAERETCEETGYSVRAVKKISGSVFRCEVIASNVCRKAVDEGFLRKRWVTAGELDSLSYRGGTWGDKRGMLSKALSGSSSPVSGGVDACGCTVGVQGWSTTSQRCSSTSQTTSTEAAECQRSGASDACGCRVGVQGWSTTSQRCSSTSQTSASEAAECQRLGASGGNELDVCGCRVGVEGWSTTSGRCSPSSQTSSSEAAACRNRMAK
uniref:Nudix hydrolase domain-containing protein n=1 Tax=Alexandrium monilatum TaxID=311494 RepID=A0A7S4VYD5_9DINO